MTLRIGEAYQASILGGVLGADDEHEIEEEMGEGFKEFLGCDCPFDWTLHVGSRGRVAVTMLLRIQHSCLSAARTPKMAITRTCLQLVTQQSAAATTCKMGSLLFWCLWLTHRLFARQPLHLRYANRPCAESSHAKKAALGLLCARQPQTLSQKHSYAQVGDCKVCLH